ncbi:MAG: LysM peptidoglycan-binding domain-containing protein [Nevskiales bacterium]|nr:LysM peptidoglycan-binding domain-containing protein [Nevskiales bacterium]
MRNHNSFIFGNYSLLAALGLLLAACASTGPEPFVSEVPPAPLEPLTVEQMPAEPAVIEPQAAQIATEQPPEAEPLAEPELLPLPEAPAATETTGTPPPVEPLAVEQVPAEAPAEPRMETEQPLLPETLATTEPPPVLESPTETDAAETPATPVRLESDAPQQYVVQKGDTLWDIADLFLKDPWQWPELWYINEQIRNPHLIYPGDVLQLTWIDGAPRLARSEDLAPLPVPEPAPSEVVPGEASVPPAVVVEKRSPQIRERPLKQPISSIPLEAIQAFLQGPHLIGKSTLEGAPYMLSFGEERILAGAGNVAYARGLDDPDVAQYRIVRKGEAYRNPDDGKVIGYEAIPVGQAEVRAHGDPGTVFIQRSFMESRIGDYLLSTVPDPLAEHFYPHAPKDVVGGRIISVYNGVTQIGQYNIVVINRGSEAGLEAGHVLSVFQTGGFGKDPYRNSRKVRLPDVHAGTLMVFKTEPQLSYALVMSSWLEIRVLDKVETPDPSVH